jgi:D-alanyl-lipoteichoic acid acyltransferase DltB (MBOAT superfamily)
LIFLPLVFALHRLLPARWRWAVLLAASLGFYAVLGQAQLLAALALVAAVTYGAGLGMARPGGRRFWLWTGVGADLAVLAGLKYLPFLAENLKALARLARVDLQVRPLGVWVTIGLSYFVFQAISYLADVYLEVEEPERHFGYFALYLAFFPKLLQGPIERAGSLLPQLRAETAFDHGNLRYGLALFLWGLFKKLVIADRLGLFANSVYNDVHAFTGLPLILGTYLYAFQIFLDFSAYTDMALGSARLFNIELTDNFDRPYLATSIADFWRRWHISFSRWIFDYIFKPLQFAWRDARAWGAAAAILVTFLASGLWHGASWTFIAWGLLHGAYLATSTLWKPYQKRLYKRLGVTKGPGLRAWQTVATFHLVCLAWIFFRAASLRDAGYVLTRMFRFQLPHGKGWLAHNVLLDQGAREFVLALALLAGLAVLSAKGPTLRRFLEDSSTPARWTLYYVLAFATLAFAVFGHGAFIYYQF